LRWVRVFSVCIMLIFLTSCSAMQSTPEKTIKNLEKSIQQMDFQAMVDCYEPHVAKGIKAISKLTGNIFGIDGEAVFDMIPLLMDIAEAAGSDSYTDAVHKYKELELSIISLEYNEDRTEATAKVDFLIEDNSEGTYFMDLVKTDGKWYLKFN